MMPESKLASKLNGKDFIITAEYMPRTGTSTSSIEASARALKDGVTAVNVADNQYGVAMSSLAASVALSRSGIEPVYQIVTRDRNRIALQSDLLGAAFLGIKNVLCISGYHQSLIGSPDSANVYDLDSIQLIAAVNKMNAEGALLDGTKIEGAFSMLVGAVANPGLKPLELNLIRLSKKVQAGASFIQTQAVFDVEAFKQWLDAANKEGIKTAIIAGVMPLTSAAEARKLNEVHTEFDIPYKVIERLESAGDPAAQKKAGLTICAEIIKKLKKVQGLRGVHILSGGNEMVVPELLAASAK